MVAGAHPVFEEAHVALDAAARLLDGCATEDLAALVAGVRAVRAHLDRVSVAITCRAEELNPAARPGRSGEHLWGSSPGGSAAGAGAGSGGGLGGDPDGDIDGDTDGTDDDVPPPPPPPPDPEEARREAERARVCSLLPRVAEAFAAGRVTGAHLDVIARVTARRDRALIDLFCSNDHDLAEKAASSETHAFRLWCQNLLVLLQEQLGRDHHDRQRRDTRLSFRTDPHTGMMRLFAQLHPELGQHLKAAIELEVTTALSDPTRLEVPGVGGPHPKMTARREHLAAHALAKLTLAPSARGGVGVQLAIVVQPDGTARYPTGDPADATTVGRLLCNATLRRILLDDAGIPLDVGRGSRLATAEQRLALAALYDTCGIPGCDVPFDHCEIHHVHWWEHLGLTDLDNLLPACSRHHHLIHNGALHITLHPDRTLTTTWGNEPSPGWPATGPPHAA